MYKKVVIASIVALGALATLPAEAEIIYTGRVSTISGTHCPDSTSCVVQSQSSTDFNDFSATLSASPTDSSPGQYTVSQQSSLTPNGISVAMSADSFFIDSSRSSLEVDFTVDTPTNFSMVGNTSWQMANGSYDIHLDGPTPLGSNDARCSFNAGGYNSCTYSNSSDPLTRTSATTMLGDGSYKLFVSVMNGGPTGRNAPTIANFKMTFSPVPLPAAAWLLASGLLGLFGFNQRRARVAG